MSAYSMDSKVGIWCMCVYVFEVEMLIHFLSFCAYNFQRATFHNGEALATTRRPDYVLHMFWLKAKRFIFVARGMI